MKNKIIFSTILLFFIVSFSSCENSMCKQCEATAVIEQFIDGESFGTTTSNVSAIEYCGDELEMIENSSPIESEITQEVQGLTQRIVTTSTYTCK